MPHNRHCNLKTAFLATSMLTLSTAGVYAQNESAETVVVTGSRIQTNGYQSPTPLSVVGAAQIQSAANANFGDFLVELPTVVGSPTAAGSTVSGNSARAGINGVSLRGLGANRTLTLLDGHRMPAANQDGSIDVSLIPQQLVSRVDVVTGGASSVYGSDAVAGVVNFILDKHFTGLKGEISAGETNYGDGQNGKISLIGGMNFFNDRNHLTVSGEYARDQGVRDGNDVKQKRPWKYNGAALMGNPLYVVGNGQPALLLTLNAGYATAAPGGVVISGPLKGLAFGQGGVPYQQNTPANTTVNGVITGVVAPYMTGGDGGLNNPKVKVDLAPEETRYNLFARDSFNVTDNFQLYAQFSMVRNFNEGYGPEPVLPDALQAAVIKLDNAYLPASVQTKMVAAGVTSIQVGSLNYDLGQLYLSTHRTSTIYTLGGSGELDIFGKPWNWDAYAQKGNTTANVTMANNISKANYLLAADAVFNSNGAVVCRSVATNPNCKPYDVMGTGLSTRSSAGQQYVHVPAWNQTFIGQNVFGASITGETPFSLWADPISLAFDVEHREEKTNITVDANSAAIDHVFGNFNPLHGSTQVSEGAVETQVPVTTSDFMLGELNINAAYRFTAYSYFGDAQTWKIGATYKPIEDITIRVTDSRDIRAPNHLEAFTPAATAFSNISDVATGTNPQYLGITKGSTKLTPEVASTLGVGAVVQPRFLPGFSMSVDYWSIDLGRVITTVSFAQTLALCYNGTRPDLCANIVRTGVSQPGALPANDVLVSITSTYVNFAKREMRGVDYEMSYDADDLYLLPGTARLHANVTNYLQDYTQTPNVYTKDAVGTITGATRWRYNATLTYNLDPITTSLTIRGTNGGVYNTTYVQCASGCPLSTSNNQTINNDTMPAYFYLDWSGSYDVSNLLGVTSTLFANIRNLENKNPPPFQANCSTLYSGCTIPSVYDDLGRVYRVGLRFRM